MKTYGRFRTALTLLIVLAAAPSALGRDGDSRDERKWEVSPFLGFFSHEGGGARTWAWERTHLEEGTLVIDDAIALDGNLFGVRVNRRVLERLAIEVSFAFDSPSRTVRVSWLEPREQPFLPPVVVMSSRFTAGETYLFGGAVRSPIGRYARFEPFVTAGAGVAIHTTGSQLVTLPAPAADMGVTRLTRDTLTSPYFTAGAGTRFAAGDNWGMRLDFRPRYLLPELSPSGGAWFFDWTFGPYLSF